MSIRIDIFTQKPNAKIEEVNAKFAMRSGQEKRILFMLLIAASV
jgi:hypothetical protein